MEIIGIDKMGEYKRHIIYEPYETIEEQEESEERIKQECEKSEEERVEGNLFNGIEILKKIESIEEEEKRWLTELFMEFVYN